MFSIAVEIGVHVHEVEQYEHAELMEWLAFFTLRDEDRKKALEEAKQRK